MKEAAIYNFINKGYSCSESVVMAAIEKGIVNKNLLPLATPFSCGISSGCLCGAIAGMQLVIGAIYGRKDVSESPVQAKNIAKYAINKFKEKNKFTCCKALTAGYDMATPERKHHCSKMVGDCAEILQELIAKENVK